MLTLSNLVVRVAGRTLLDGASASVAAGQRVGLVGPNGTGKTTLFRLILGDGAPDSGQIEMPNRWRAATVPQEAPAGPETPLDIVLASDPERAELLAEADIATDANRIADIHVRLADIGAHEAPARAASILAGLGLGEADQHRPCSDFSGGWRMRVALAATLFAQPDLLLLDEPTNHLDLESTLWLEGFLKRYQGTVLVISHDRDLLNRAVERILHLDRQKLVSYAGNYDRFERTRAERQALMAAEAKKQEVRRKHMQAFVDRFRYKASKARQAQSRLKAIEKLGPVVAIDDAHARRFDFPAPDKLAPPIIAFDDAVVGYGTKPVLSGLTERISMDDRIALLGANGNGKSTLAKLLAGRLEPMAGEIRRSTKLKVGYFAQHQTDELSPAATVLAQAQAAMPDHKPEQVRDYLGKFGFTQNAVSTVIGDLSGGEKARLLLAMMCRDAPHILLLDEPTNHLDIDSRQALTDALNDYDGAVVLISHDAHLIELTADRLWLVANGTVRPFDGDMDDYRRLRKDANSGKPKEPGNTGGEHGKAKRKQAADARAVTAPLRRAIGQAEKTVERLTTEQGALSKRLNDPALYEPDADPAHIVKLQSDLHRLQAKLEKAEAEWLELQAELEMREAG
ncbi:MAG: ABC-F family ATP-binding cassette domain-containing protein [Pseudomonadota bacterium]